MMDVTKPALIRDLHQQVLGTSMDVGANLIP
jgi:hypothetical protein